MIKILTITIIVNCKLSQEKKRMVLMRDLLIKSSALNIEILKLICILCVTVSKMFLPILLLLNLLLDVKGDSCLSNNDLAGLVLGTSLATLLITGCITIFTCFLVRKRQLGEYHFVIVYALKIFEYSHSNKGFYDLNYIRSFNLKKKKSISVQNQKSIDLEFLSYSLPYKILIF